MYNNSKDIDIVIGSLFIKGNREGFIYLVDLFGHLSPSSIKTVFLTISECIRTWDRRDSIYWFVEVLEGLVFNKIEGLVGNSKEL